jgi:hypothetical protein
MGLKSEVLALAFGALLIFVTFGDGHIWWFIGNLDTILGLAFWHVLDAFYPIASIVVFLLYGWVKGKGLKINALTLFLFVSFVALIILINIDDVVQLVHISLTPSKTYWAAIEWIYPVYSGFAFFLFGKKHEALNAQAVRVASKKAYS